MSIRAKICGLSTLDAARTAIDNCADFLGFIHFAKSPRHLTLNAMAELLSVIRSGTAKLQLDTVQLVSVVVDPSDDLLSSLARDVRPDLIQLHGHETVERVAEIRSRVGLPVIKAISVENASDIAAAQPFDAVADYLLFDAKTPKGADLPGGMGLSFDWTLMRAWTGAKPWFLAGGLEPGNVTEAIALSGAGLVDVSSGVESAPGVKDIARISGFLKAAKSL